MDFFHSQETLTTLQWILRSVVGYIFLIIIVKVMGRRSIAQLNFLDFAIAIVIGNIIAHPLSDEQLGLKGSMTTMTALVMLYTISVFITLKSKKIRRFFSPDPLPLVKNGQFISKNLTKARISVDYILSEARKEKIEDAKKIALAFWEPDGSISFFVKPNDQTITRRDLNIVTKPFDFPKTIIREGSIEKPVLQEIGRDENWLITLLKTNHQSEVQDVLLATIDQNNVLKVFLYQ